MTRAMVVLGAIFVLMVVGYYAALGPPRQMACLDAGGMWDYETSTCIGATE